MTRKSTIRRVKHLITLRPRSRADLGGVTLIELMVGLAVLAILLAIGAPSFQSFMASSRLSSASNDLIGSLALARSEAVRRGSRITLCKSDTGERCVTDGTWSQGWIVFVDNTRPDATASVDAGDTILTRNAAVANGLSITGDANVANFVSFSAQGDVRLMNGTPQTGSVRVCSPLDSLSNDRRARDIAIGATGRLSTSTPAGVDASCPQP